MFKNGFFAKTIEKSKGAYRCEDGIKGSSSYHY